MTLDDLCCNLSRQKETLDFKHLEFQCILDMLCFSPCYIIKHITSNLWFVVLSLKAIYLWTNCVLTFGENETLKSLWYLNLVENFWIIDSCLVISPYRFYICSFRKEITGGKIKADERKIRLSLSVDFWQRFLQQRMWVHRKRSASVSRQI